MSRHPLWLVNTIFIYQWSNCLSSSQFAAGKICHNSSDHWFNTNQLKSWAGKDAPTNCSPMEVTSWGQEHLLSSCLWIKISRITASCCRYQGEGWGQLLIGFSTEWPWDGSLGSLGIHMFRDSTLWTQGPVQNRHVMVYFIYCSCHWADTLNLRSGFLGSHLAEIKSVSQVIKKVIVLCVVTWK